MKTDQFNIYIDRLHKGEIEEIRCISPASFLEVEEEDFHFVGDFKVVGEAYLANDTVILKLSLSCKAEMPCSICNEKTPFEVKVPNFYHTVPLSEIEGVIYDYGPLIRESLLLETPQFVECHGGHCPDRKDVEKYLAVSEGYHPFADLSESELEQGES